MRPETSFRKGLDDKETLQIGGCPEQRDQKVKNLEKSAKEIEVIKT